MLIARNQDYQTIQRDCSLRWDLLRPEEYIKDKVVLDIGCAEGWFVERSLKAGAKQAIGIDVHNFHWSGDGQYYISDGFLFCCSRYSILDIRAHWARDHRTHSPVRGPVCIF